MILFWRRQTVTKSRAASAATSDVFAENLVIEGVGQLRVGLYITIDITIDINDDIHDQPRIARAMKENRETHPGSRWQTRRHWMRYWMRSTAAVPKGFLRYELLKALSEKPMSGSEIMSEIEKQTSGYWRPSPGSIYPLLAWLQDKGCVKEAAEKEPGMRRYTLTEQGKALLDEETRTREELHRRLEHFRPKRGLMGPIWLDLDRENARELRKTTKGLAMAVRDLFHELRREHSAEAVEQTKMALEEATNKICNITKNLHQRDTE